MSDRIIQVIPRRAVGPECQRWTPEKFESFFGIKYLSHLHFNDDAPRHQVVKNCPWILQKSRWGEEHRQLGEKYHQEIEEGFVDDVVIKWIDDEIGYGLFANRNIPANAFVGEYTGVLRRLSRWRPDSNAYCFQYPSRFLTWKYYIIDAFREGNEMRFVNHSEDPNLQPSCLVDEGLCHLVFFTNQAVSEGEELTFNYGSDYWRHRQKR